MLFDSRFMIQDLKINFLHHAYCLEGDSIFIKRELIKKLESLDFKTKSNLDFLYTTYEGFGIDDAHKIGEFQNRKAVSGSKKIIAIETKTLTREAQNSLLKTFEEPSPNTHFFLIVPNSEILLETLRSRLDIQKIQSDQKNDLAKKFLKGSKKERLEIVKELTEEKNKLEAINLLNQIEKAVYKKDNGVKKERLELMESINKFRSYLNDRSPSIKMLLEHIALITPKI